MHWGHGYFTEFPYTTNFFRELTPGWIDFCALIKGHASPRLQDGAPFSYLELGSGMGAGLCLLAAAHPEGRFIGIDFMPVHIVHSRNLAARLGLHNIAFLEADLLTIGENPSELAALGVEVASFHYVVAHGLLSWVSETVQNALMQVATAALRPEGFFYSSYNTYPGWLSITSFQHLASLEFRRSDPSQPLIALQRAAASLTGLLGSADRPTPLSRASPFLLPEMEQMATKDLAYLVQEYANHHWQPFYVAELLELCSHHKLRYIATANLPDLFENLLPEPVRGIVAAEPNPSHQQTLLDLGVNRSFRRDLFSRGSLPLRDVPLQARLEETVVRLQEAPPTNSYTFRAEYGEVTGKPEVYGALEAALQEGPLTLAELCDHVDQPLQEVVQAVALLLHANRVGLDRSHCDAFPQAQANAERVNAYLLSEIQAGAPYAHLMAPAIGSGVSISPLEALLLEALRQGLEGNVLAACVQMGLQGLNVELREKDGKPLTTDAARRKAILRAAEAFASQRLPFLRSLGVVPS
jgi:SAM-dependent methyltransferase